MTWLGPSSETGPGTQPQNSKWSFQFYQCFVQYYYRQGSGPILQCIHLSLSSYILHRMVQSVQSRRGQIYGQGSGPRLHTSRKVFLSTGQWPNVIYVYNVTTLKGESPLLWYLKNGNLGGIKGFKGIKESVKCFVKNFRTQTLKYPETSLHPGDAQVTLQTTIQPREATLLLNTVHSTQHTLQEATLWPRDSRRPPYGPETAPTVSPAYPSFRQSIPMVPSVPSKHTDYKTTRLQILPANREHNTQKRQIQRKPTEAKLANNKGQPANQRKA